MSLCVVCQFDGRRQADLIDLKDGQIDQLRADLAAARAERDALASEVERYRWERTAKTDAALTEGKE